jgi:hypothetical protein
MPSRSEILSGNGFPSDYLRPPLTRNRQIPAWLLSLVLHTGLFLLLLLAVSVVPRGATNTETRTGGIVLVDLQSESTEYLSEGDTREVNSTASAEQSPPPTLVSDQLPPDLPGMESSEVPLTGVGKELVDGLPGAEQLIEGEGANLRIGGRVTTEVFGVKGTGSKFVYVFDRSKSMEGYGARPLLAARQALLQSLQSLGEKHQFQILFYNEGISIFKYNQLNQLHFATEELKSAATQFVKSIRGDGGTDHMNALKQALLLKPDVIFLLTDAEGGFSRAELRELNQLNRSAAVINAIEFGEIRGRDRSLETLTAENGGQYVFKDIRTLRAE